MKFSLANWRPLCTWHVRPICSSELNSVLTTTPNVEIRRIDNYPLSQRKSVATASPAPADERYLCKPEKRKAALCRPPLSLPHEVLICAARYERVVAQLIEFDQA